MLVVSQATCTESAWAPRHYPEVRVVQALTVDCANGVGAQKLRAFQRHLLSLQLDLRNTGAGVLNGGCGADHVQKAPANQRLPTDFSGVAPDAR